RAVTPRSSNPMQSGRFSSWSLGISLGRTQRAAEQRAELSPRRVCEPWVPRRPNDPSCGAAARVEPKPSLRALGIRTPKCRSCGAATKTIPKDISLRTLCHGFFEERFEFLFKGYP